MTEIKEKNFEQYTDTLLMLTNDVKEIKLDEIKILKTGSIVKIIQILSAGNLVFVEDVNKQIWQIELSKNDMELLGISNINNTDRLIVTDYFIVLTSENINYLKSTKNKKRLKMCNFNMPFTVIMTVLNIISILGFVLSYFIFYDYVFYFLGLLVLFIFSFFIIGNILDNIRNYYGWAFSYFENIEVAQELEYFQNISMTNEIDERISDE